MALTERRYIFLSRGGLVQRAPLQTQSVHTILTVACANRQCLLEIATGAKRPRNDKSGAISILTIVCSGRQRTAGSGMPLPYTEAPRYIGKNA